MSAIVIGFGVAVAVLGVVLGGIGYGSVRTPLSIALMTMGTTAFVGGFLLVALGFILRVLREIADKLEGAVHFEPDEEEAPAARTASAVVLETEEFIPAPPEFVDEVPPPAPPSRPTAAEVVAAGGGASLPSWFRRKQAQEAAEPAPEYEPAPSYPPEPEFEPPQAFRPAPEPARREPPPFLRPTAEPEEPSYEPAEPEPRAPEPRAPEPRTPRPREEFAAEPGTPPAFLRDTDLLAEEEPAPPEEPEVTVLKSGTIGGMTYKLYSDGSIEADLPDGTLRFASLQDLRDHVAGGASRGG